MTRELATIYCRDCGLVFEKSDIVMIDEMNELSHDFCIPTGFPIKDEGNYEEIARKYPYFYKK